MREFSGRRLARAELRGIYRLGALSALSPNPPSVSLGCAAPNTELLSCSERVFQAELAHRTIAANGDGHFSFFIAWRIEQLWVNTSAASLFTPAREFQDSSVSPDFAKNPALATTQWLFQCFPSGGISPIHISADLPEHSRPASPRGACCRLW